MYQGDPIMTSRALVWGTLMACCLQVLATRESLAQVPETNPTEPGNVIDAVPDPRSVIPYGVPQAWFDLKDDAYDWSGLTECVARVKSRFADEDTVTVSADQQIHYEHLVAAMLTRSRECRAHVRRPPGSGCESWRGRSSAGGRSAC